MATPVKYRHPVAINRDGMAQIGPTLFQLRGIRFAEGEGGDAPAAPAAPAPAAPAPAAPAAPAPAPAPAAPAAAPAAPAPVQYRGDPDEYVRELREEAKNHRLAAEKAAQENTTTQQERDAATAERDMLKREKAVLLAAPRLGANADLLLDTTSFTEAIKAIDLSQPADVTQAAVDKAITDALERNSAFKAGPILPGTSGGGHQGGSATTTTPTIEGAVKARLGG